MVSISVAHTFQEAMTKTVVQTETEQTESAQSVDPVVPQSTTTSASGAVEVATVEIDGENYMGLLSIPQLGLELPVASSCTYAKLDKTPCLYVGSFEEGYLVIGAHNYKAHFGNISLLSLGDEITIMDAYGKLHTYALIAQETIDGSDLEGLCLGDWDLTLFTCLYGDNTQRQVARFQAIDVESVVA